MAQTTPNMGLRLWNLTTDPYDHTQLADNFAKLDEHDHSGNKGKQIPTGGIEDAAITSSKIAPGTFTTLAIDDLSITTAKYADGSVTAAKLASNSVASANIVNATIQTADIGNLQITTGLVADDAITSAKLSDDGAVDANRAVNTNHIRDGAVSAAKISSALADTLGVTTSAVRRGKTVIATDETWAGTPGTYGFLPTPDRVTSLVVPSEGIIWVLYRALWELDGASNAASAAIFLDSTQLVSVEPNSAAPASTATSLVTTGDEKGLLFTSSTGDAGGMKSLPSDTTGSGIDASKAQTWGAASSTRWQRIPIEVQAGTYTISVKYKTNVASGGTLKVANRKLYVSTETF